MDIKQDYILIFSFHLEIQLDQAEALTKVKVNELSGH